MSETTYKILSLVIDTIIAIGTISVSFVSIFGSWIKSKWLKPKLDIEYNKKYKRLIAKEGDKDSSDEQKSPMVFFQIQVKNIGNIIATNTYAIIDNIYHLRDDGQAWDEYIDLYSSYVLWQTDKTVINIPQDIPQYLCFINILNKNIDPSEPEHPSVHRTYIGFNINDKMIDSELKIPGTYICQIKFVSDKLSTQTLCLEIYINQELSFENYEQNDKLRITVINQSEFNKRIQGK